MSATTFVATHCGVTFTGAEGAAALAQHMRAVHHFQGFKPGDSFYHTGNAPGWARGGILPPVPWTAPRRSMTPEQVAAKWGYDVWYFDTERQEVAA